MGGKGGCGALGISRACQSQETPKCMWTPGPYLKGGCSGGWGAGRREAIWSSRESKRHAAGRPALALPSAVCDLGHVILASSGPSFLLCSRILGWP